MNTPPLTVPVSGPLVILDAPARAADIYGRVFDRLGVQPVHPSTTDPEAILALDPAVIFLSSEWTHEWRLVSAAARRRGVPVVYVIDGVLEWSYLWNNLSFIRPWGTMLQPLLASDLCVIGRHPARILASMGLADRTHLVGLPRFDTLSRRRVVEAGRRPNVLVATARTAGHDVEQQVLARRALRDLHSWFQTQPSIDVVWRIAADLAEDIGVQADIGGSFDDALAQTDALLSFTSTCLLEGMHKGMPVAQIDYRPAPLYVATAWEIRCADHIAPVVQELLHPPAAKLAWQDACFADELERGDATGALAAAVREILARPRAVESLRAPDEASADTAQTIAPADARPAPVEVPGRLDFRQIHSELSCFAVGSAPVLQYELAAAHHQLRHTRNEKGFLQRDCIELVEAATGNDIAGLRTFSLIDHLASAGIEGSASAELVAIQGRPVRALVLPAPAEITYCVSTGLAGKLSLAISLHPDCWTRSDSGHCAVRVLCDGAKLFDAKLDFRNSPSDRKWWWLDCPVTATPKGVHTFVLQVVGPSGARAVWRTPAFRWHEAAPGANIAFRHRAAIGADFYVPGRTVA